MKWEAMCKRTVLGVALFGITLITIGVIGIGGPIEATYGEPIPNSQLDGILGSEWSDAVEYDTRLTASGTTYSCRVQFYVKHDGEYLYFAVRTSSRIPGRKIALWMVFDADADNKFYVAGDDSLVVYETRGNLDNNVDFAYTGIRPSSPKPDYQVGGRNDKWGAGITRGNESIFETKMDLASGDSRGNDISLGPNDSIGFSLGLMSDRIDIESPHYTLKLAQPALTPCECEISSPSLIWCKGNPVNFRVSNVSNQFCDFFTCSVTPAFYIPEAPHVIDSGTVFGLRPGQSAGLSWDQKSSSGNQVMPGSYCISCDCSEDAFCFSIVECVQPPPYRPEPIPEPPQRGGPLPPAPMPAPGEDTPSESVVQPDCKEPPVESDTFHSTASGWPNSELMGYDLQLEEYFIAVENTFVDSWSVYERGPSRSSFCYTALAKPAGNSGYGIYGLVFGYENDDNFYLFSITTDGSYSLHKREEGEFLSLLAQQSSSSIKRGSATNELSVVAYNGNIWLYINREAVNSLVADSSLRGKFGFLASPGLRVRFDDFKLQEVVIR